MASTKQSIPFPPLRHPDPKIADPGKVRLGDCTITALIDSFNVTATVNTAPSSTAADAAWKEQSFSAVHGYPRTAISQNLIQSNRSML